MTSATEGEGMSKLIPITLFSIILAILSHRYSFYDHINGVYLRKERFFYAIMSIGMILFAGLRITYNDTGSYRQYYDVLISADEGILAGVDWMKIGDNPGFVVVQRLMKYWNLSQYSFIMLFSIFTMGTHLWFFKKYSCNVFLTIFLFFTFDGYLFQLAAIKQCTAMAFCLIATDRAIQKKYISFVLYVLIGTLFHPYALMYLCVPFLCFVPWSKYTFIMLVIFACVGFGLQSMLGTLLDVTDMLGEQYDSSSFNGVGINPIRLLVTSVPLLLSFLAKEQIQTTKERDQHMILNLCMLNVELMFVALFGTANYFGRLANYFLPFQALAYPWILRQFDARGRKTVVFGTVLFYVAYFVYSNRFAGYFDSNYWSITFGEFLKLIFVRDTI